MRRWSTGVTYDEHGFAPVSTWTGPTQVPEDRKFVWPWVQFDLIQDDFLKLWNHDQIARTEDFYIGTAASVRVGWADTVWGSSQSALIFQSNASKGFREGGSTLLLFGDFSGRVTDGELRNGLLDASCAITSNRARTGCSSPPSSPPRAGGWISTIRSCSAVTTACAVIRCVTRMAPSGCCAVEQRYFTDWYPFRLFRVGAAVFFDAGRVWGNAPLAPQNYGWLKDAGFGLRFGNARSGFGNVVHVDSLFPSRRPPASAGYSSWCRRKRASEGARARPHRPRAPLSVWVARGQRLGGALAQAACRGSGAPAGRAGALRAVGTAAPCGGSISTDRVNVRFSAPCSAPTFTTWRVTSSPRSLRIAMVTKYSHGSSSGG